MARDCVNREWNSSSHDMIMSKLGGKFDFHRAIHRNITSIVKPTRCTKVSNLFYFRMTLYMFRTIFPSIIRRSGLYLQQQAFTVPASKQTAVSV